MKCRCMYTSLPALVLELELEQKSWYEGYTDNYNYTSKINEYNT